MAITSGCVKQAAGTVLWLSTWSRPHMFSTALIPCALAACASMYLPATKANVFLSATEFKDRMAKCIACCVSACCLTEQCCQLDCRALGLCVKRQQLSCGFYDLQSCHKEHMHNTKGLSSRSYWMTSSQVKSGLVRLE